MLSFRNPEFRSGKRGLLILIILSGVLLFVMGCAALKNFISGTEGFLGIGYTSSTTYHNDGTSTDTTKTMTR